MATQERKQLLQRAQKEFCELIKKEGFHPEINDWPESMGDTSSSEGIFSILYQHYKEKHKPLRALLMRYVVAALYRAADSVAFESSDPEQCRSRVRFEPHSHT